MNFNAASEATPSFGSHPSGSSARSGFQEGPGKHYLRILRGTNRQTIRQRRQQGRAPWCSPPIQTSGRRGVH
eukprot:5756135-Pyramimonas_sp.AAC.1